MNFFIKQFFQRSISFIFSNALLHCVTSLERSPNSWISWQSTFFWMKVGEKYCISFPFISWIYDWPVAIHLYSRYSDSNEKLFFWILQDLFWHSSLCSEEFWEEWLFSQVSDKKVTVETCLKQYLNLWKICRFGVDNWVNWECCSKWKSVRILTRYFWRSHISEVVWALANKSQ